MSNPATSFLKMTADFFKGMLIPFRAMGIFLTQPRYWHYALIPIIISLICYFGLGWLFWVYVKPLIDKITPLAADVQGFFEYVKMFLRWLLYVASVIAAVTFFLLTFTTAFVMIAAPFVDQLAVQYERDKYGYDFKYTGFKQFIHYCWTSTINTGRVGLIILFLTVIFFFVNIFAPIAGIIISSVVIGYYFGVTFLIYSSEHRRLSYKEFKRQLKGSKALIMGMGTIVYIALFLPFVAILFLPIAVIAGTITYNEYVLARSQPQLPEDTLPPTPEQEPEPEQ